MKDSDSASVVSTVTAADHASKLAPISENRPVMEDQQDSKDNEADEVEESSDISFAFQETNDESINGDTNEPIDSRNNPIYITSGNESWELTWPIWHMLPHSERKTIAQTQGFQTIGDFEESMILSRAVQETDALNVNQNHLTDQQRERIHQQMPVPYDSSQLYELENRPNGYGLPTVAERSPPIIGNNNNTQTTNNDDNNDDADSVPSSTENEEDEEIDPPILYDQDKQESQTEQEPENLIEEGGLILLLPDDLILHCILPYLNIDDYSTCSLVSSHWKTFTRTELVYRELCKRCYLNQSKRKTLHVARFGGSYRTMLEQRPRVKTGGGMYVLKCTKIKKVQRDMWTEVPIGAVIENTFYRYMYFFENGTVLYCLTHLPPYEMIPKFLKKKLQKKEEEQEHTISNHNNNRNRAPVDKSGAVYGTYEVQKNQVTVNVTHPWHHVKMVMNLYEDGCEGARGRFWAMEFCQHFSSKSGDFDEYYSRDLVEYEVPTELFRYFRDNRL